MNAIDFAYWLQGFVELTGEKPTEAQWTLIKQHLNTVFNKVTPPLGGWTDKGVVTSFPTLPDAEPPKVEAPTVTKKEFDLDDLVRRLRENPQQEIKPNFIPHIIPYDESYRWTGDDHPRQTFWLGANKGSIC